MRRFAVLLMFAGVPVVDAQDAEPPAETREEILRRRRQVKSRELVPYQVSSLESRVMSWERKLRFPQNIFVKGFKGFRPVVGGMPSGSGFVVGAGYIYGVDSEQLQVEANARLSTSGYEMLDAEIQFPTRRSGSPILAHLNGAYRDLEALPFYGLGPGSRNETRIRYRLEDRAVGSGLTFRPSRFFELGGTANHLTPDVGLPNRGPSIELLGDPRVTGLLVGRPDFVWYGSYVLLNLHDDSPLRPAGVSFRLEGQRYDEIGADDYNFNRVIAEVQAHVPLGHRNRMLAARVRASRSNPDGARQQVPFYLMETIGGAKTLRGFDEYRYADTRNFLLNLEYRWEVWSYLDFSFFFDAGEVYPQGTKFSVKNLQAGYGFGVRLETPGRTTFRIDIAHSNERWKLHISGGPRF